MIVVFLFLRILSLLDVLLLDVANDPQLSNNHTWDNTISNTTDQNRTIFCYSKCQNASTSSDRPT